MDSEDTMPFAEDDCCQTADQKTPTNAIRQKLIAFAQDPSMGFPQPTSERCIVRCSMELGLGDGMMDSIRAIARGLRADDLVPVSSNMAKTAIQVSTTQVRAIPHALEELNRAIEGFSLGQKARISEVLRNAMQRNSSKPLVDLVVMQMFQWKADAFNLFIEEETAKKVWLWSGMFWYRRDLLGFFLDVVESFATLCDESISRRAISSILGQRPLGGRFCWSSLSTLGKSWGQSHNQHPGYIFTAQGMLCLDSSTLVPHSPKFFTAFVTDVIPDMSEFDYDALCKTPCVEERMAEISGYDDDLVDELRWSIGNGLFGAPNVQKQFLWCLGQSDSGKSALVKILRAGLPMYVTIGDSTTINRSSTKATVSGTDILALQGMRIVIYEEIKEIRNSDLIKNFLSGGEISAREIRCPQALPVRFSVMPLFLANCPLRSSDIALMDKMHEIQFRCTFGNDPSTSNFIRRPDVVDYFESPSGRMEARQYLIRCALFYAANKTKFRYSAGKRNGLSLSSPSSLHDAVARLQPYVKVVHRIDKCSMTFSEFRTLHAMRGCPLDGVTVKCVKAIMREVLGWDNDDSVLQALGKIHGVFPFFSGSAERCRFCDHESGSLKDSRTTCFVNLTITDEGKKLLEKKNKTW